MDASGKRFFTNYINPIPSKNVQKTIESLSDDDLIIVFSFLDLKNQLKARKVCHRWRKLIGYTLSRKKSLSLVNDTENVVDWKYERWFEVDGHHKTFTRVHFKCLSSSIKSLLSVCSNVKDLDLECYDINTQTLRVIAQRCPNLERINFDSCNGYNIYMSQCLAKCFKRLRILNLSCVGKLTDNILGKVLQSVPQLVALNVCGTDITGQCLSLLSPNLLHLNISYCWKLENIGLTALTQSNADNLQELVANNFNFESNLANDCLAAICSKFSQLQRLDMRLGSCVEDTFAITTLHNTGLSAIARLRQLKVLIIRRICVLDDISLREILFRCPLEHLELDMSTQSSITDSSITYLPHCSDLKVLELSNNQQISGQMLTQVVQRLPKLIRLILRFTKATNDVITSAATHCPDLQTRAKAKPNSKYEFTAINSGIGSAGVHPKSAAKLRQIPTNIEFKVSNGRTRQYLWFESGRFYYSRAPESL